MDEILINLPVDIWALILYDNEMINKMCMISPAFKEKYYDNPYSSLWTQVYKNNINSNILIDIIEDPKELYMKIMDLYQERNINALYQSKAYKLLYKLIVIENHQLDEDQYSIFFPLTGRIDNNIDLINLIIYLVIKDIPKCDRTRIMDSFIRKGYDDLVYSLSKVLDNNNDNNINYNNLILAVTGSGSLNMLKFLLTKVDINKLDLPLFLTNAAIEKKLNIIKYMDENGYITQYTGLPGFSIKFIHRYMELDEPGYDFLSEYYNTSG